MVACVLIPGFELRAALRARPSLALRPAALAPAEPLIGSVTAAADAQGVKPGMRMGEALATCPELVLVEQDPSAAEQAWEEILRRLEDAGFEVDSGDLGCVYFETRGVERLYGGAEAALERALAAVGSAWDPRAGAAGRRFAALAAANVARPGQVLIVADERTREFLAPLPLALLPLAGERRRELEELGVRNVGELAGLPGGAVSERLGPDGRRAWSLARGRDRGRVRGRRAPAELIETLEFPEAIGNELTLRRALAVLVERLLGRAELGERFLRKVALSATLVGGGSWRRQLTLREPFAEADRLRVALGPKLAEIPGPLLKLKLEALELTESTGQQLMLVRPEGDELQGMLRDGLRQVKASTGEGGVCTVVEVAPWSRIPEQRALLVARDE
ncbi:MAG: DNA polymerase Y family protein [Actinobacteria bacterium]|jgi:protein ImuB|nr:MAG: DNA polymerase Y family protein [Actinomycetota bacterium]